MFRACDLGFRVQDLSYHKVGILQAIGFPDHSNLV